MAYTNIDDPSAYFTTTLYTGNGNADHAITNDANAGNFQPDMLWYKSQSYASGHILYDSSRGDTEFFTPNTTARGKSDANMLESFDSNGFTLNADTDGNRASNTFVGWQWKCNGGTTTSFSESGNNPGGTRQTNTGAGFSMIAYTGTGANASCQLAHGLPSTPEFILFKRRDANQVWAVWHQGIGDDYKLVLNEEAAQDADGAFMNSTLPDATNIYVGGTSVNTNADNGTYMCYAFSPIQGYSKFSSYVGNGNANGVFNYTGFKPAFVLIKKYTTAADSWVILDNKRDPDNVVSGRLFPDLTNAESTSTDMVDFLSNGFKLRTSGSAYNGSGVGYIYIAFAEAPFVTSTGTPTTAR